ncbi:MAG: HupE/UreJ family protein [Bermanella sp.]
MLTNTLFKASLRLFMALLLTGLFFHAKCYGHEGRPVYIEITQNPDALYNVRWKVPPVMQAGSEPVINLVGNNCKMVQGNNRPALSGQKQFQCESQGNEEISVLLTYPNNNPALSSLIQLNKLSGKSFSLFNGPDILTIALPDKVGFLQVAQQYIEAGLIHILKGYDHLLFVLCLMQIAGGLRRIFITITGFTLAHSVTLALASLEIIHIRVDLVEVLIALSIVMLAVEMAKAKKGSLHTSLIWKHPATVASLFGLLHGLGFASALGDLGLPSTMKLPALAFFNIGVELGQILFIGLVITLLISIKKIYLFFKEKFLYTQTDSALENQTGTLVSTTLPLWIIYMVGISSGYWFVERGLALFI